MPRFDGDRPWKSVGDVLVVHQVYDAEIYCSSRGNRMPLKPEDVGRPVVECPYCYTVVEEPR
jgi:hypothetical protein